MKAGSWRWRILSAATLIIAFALLVFAVRTGKTERFDRSMLLLFHDLTTSRALGPHWLPETVRDLTGLGSNSVLIVVVMVAAGFLVAAGLWRSVTTLILAVLSDEALCLALKMLVDRPRPRLVANAPEVFTSSFPSSHAMVSVLTYGLLAAILCQRTRRPGLKAYAFLTTGVLTAVVGLTRVYLGVHWASDVVAGWMAGAAWAILVWAVARGWCARDGDLVLDGDAIHRQPARLT